MTASVTHSEGRTGCGQNHLKVRRVSRRLVFENLIPLWSFEWPSDELVLFSDPKGDGLFSQTILVISMAHNSNPVMDQIHFARVPKSIQSIRYTEEAVKGS